MLNEYQVRHVLYLVLLILVCEDLHLSNSSTFLMHCQLTFSFMMILVLLRLWKEFDL